MTHCYDIIITTISFLEYLKFTQHREEVRELIRRELRRTGMLENENNENQKTETAIAGNGLKVQ